MMRVLIQMLIAQRRCDGESVVATATATTTRGRIAIQAVHITVLR